MKKIIATARSSDNKDVITLFTRDVNVEEVQQCAQSLIKRSEAELSESPSGIQLLVKKGQSAAFLNGLNMLMSVRGVQVTAAA